MGAKRLEALRQVAPLPGRASVPPAPADHVGKSVAVDVCRHDVDGGVRFVPVKKAVPETRERRRFSPLLPDLDLRVLPLLAHDLELTVAVDVEHRGLVGAGAAEGAVDASNMLKPALARGELRCVGATTIKEYRKYIEKDAALERRFQPVMVEEPNVEDTISILRGLKEKYEVHHGVRIKDSALVAAATLSHRYITDRFLPDKAIDLIDESTSRLRIEIDSMPAEIDDIQRKITQLEIEREALKKEKDQASEDRLQKIEKELKGITATMEEMTTHWRKEKDAILKIGEIKERLESTRSDAQVAERQGDLSRAAELKYGTLN